MVVYIHLLLNTGVKVLMTEAFVLFLVAGDEKMLSNVGCIVDVGQR